MWPSGPDRSSKKFARVAVAILRPGISGEAGRGEDPEVCLIPSIIVLADVPRTDLISNPLISVKDTDVNVVRDWRRNISNRRAKTKSQREAVEFWS